MTQGAPTPATNSGWLALASGGAPCQSHASGSCCMPEQPAGCLAQQAPPALPCTGWWQPLYTALYQQQQQQALQYAAMCATHAASGAAGSAPVYTITLAPPAAAVCGDVADGVPIIDVVRAALAPANVLAAPWGPASCCSAPAASCILAPTAPVHADDEATSAVTPTSRCGGAGADCRSSGDLVEVPRSSSAPPSAAGSLLSTGSHHKRPWQRPSEDRLVRLRVACLIARCLRARGLDIQLGSAQALNNAVRKVEGLLYVSAESLEEYVDEASLARRIKDAARCPGRRLGATCRPPAADAAAAPPPS